MENENEERIIGYRIKLRYGDAIAGIILTILFGIFFISTLSLPCGILVLIFLILTIVEFVKVIKNNNLPAFYITQIDQIIRLYMDYNNKTEIAKLIELPFNEITWVNYKLKKSTIVTSYYFSNTHYNYGKLIIYTQTDKIVLRNVAEPDKCCDKLIELLKLDIVK